ncbi:MAG: class II glutamine amidotransferase, partial [Bacteroidales bacterium]|nr:class II glutamine amidotransferase [Bacteroidales bacterium]
MCGIIGYTGTKYVKDILVGGLKKLEYRGYDSAGIAVHNGHLKIVKSKGKINELKTRLHNMEDGNTGIAHTRWATHGEPSELNSHPHVSFSGDLVMVHNGIIENADELKSRIKTKGYNCISDTDTEALLNYIDYKYQNNGKRILEALQESLADVVGSYAIVIIEKKHHERLVICRKGSPLVLGYDETGTYVASDIYALADHTDR